MTEDLFIGTFDGRQQPPSILLSPSVRELLRPRIWDSRWSVWDISSPNLSAITGGGPVTRPRGGVAHTGLERGASVRHHRFRVLLEGLNAHSLFRASASGRLLTTCDRQCACSTHALTLPTVLIVVAPRHSHRRRADGTWPATGNVPTIPATALALCIPVLFLCLTDHVLSGLVPTAVSVAYGPLWRGSNVHALTLTEVRALQFLFFHLFPANLACPQHVSHVSRVV